MTNPVILLGTQSNGETLPVQVDATGRLVAEGLQGPPGADGQPGAEGPPGGSFPLPPDPFEGALLGWLNGGLAWVNGSIPIPEGVFGPITAWDEQSALITVQGTIPDSVQNGVYLTQTDQFGVPTRPDKPWNISREWSSVSDADSLSFDGSTAYKPDSSSFSSRFTVVFLSPSIEEVSSLVVGTTEQANVWINGESVSASYQSGVGMVVSNPPATVSLIEAEASPAQQCQLTCVKVNNLILVDQSGAQLEGRVNTRLSDTQLLVVPTLAGVPFVPSQYLKAPAQRVAPWVYYNDPNRLLHEW